MKMNKNYFSKDIPGYGPDVPNWYEPEDEGSQIKAIIISAIATVNKKFELNESKVME